MAEAYAVPQNAVEKLLSSLGKQASSGRESLNKIIRHEKSGIGLGNLVFGQGPEMMEEMAWGKSPIIPSGHGGRLDPRIADIVGIAAPLAAAGKKFAKEGLKDLLKVQPQRQAEGGYIGGINSDKANIKKWGEATIMKSNGKSADEIYKKTGWWLDHPDKKPRFEFAHKKENLLSREDLHDEFTALEDLMLDNKIQGVKSTIGQGRRKAQLIRLDEDKGKWKDKLRNSPAEEHYSKYFKTIDYKKETDPTNMGSFMVAHKGKPPVVRLDEDMWWNPKEELLTAQHETQHAISRYEGFAPGGSGGRVKRYIETQAKRAIKHYKAQKKLYGRLDPEAEKNLKDAYNDLYMIGDDPDDINRLYKGVADESQARLVESRSKLSQMQMNKDPFYKKYDTPVEDMIDLSPLSKWHSFEEYLKIRDQVRKHVK